MSGMPLAPAVAAFAADHQPTERAQPVLQPFQIRLLEEKDTLDRNIEWLGEFIAGPAFKGLDQLEKARMRRECALKTELSTVLGARIAAAR